MRYKCEGCGDVYEDDYYIPYQEFKLQWVCDSCLTVNLIREYPD